MSEPTKSRRAAREAAFQAAYQCTIGHVAISKACDDVLSRKEFAEDVFDFIRQLADGMVTRTKELDDKFAPYLKKGWTPERLAVNDILVLRLAVYELYNFDDIPPKVTITEAVSLAKKFGDENSGRFINGVLAKVLDASPKKDWGSVPNTPAPVDDIEDTEVDIEVETEVEPVIEVVPESDEKPEAGSWVIKSDD